MKFEKITEKKFTSFKKHEVNNLNVIVGGGVDTDAGPSHDEGTHSGTGPVLDDVVFSPDGTPMSSDH